MFHSKLLNASRRQPCACRDCSTPTMWIGEYYMVHDELWKQTGVIRGFLCIGCLEKRIGRMLTPDDFMDVPLNSPHYNGHVNWLIEHSPRLLNRLGFNDEEKT